MVNIKLVKTEEMVLAIVFVLTLIAGIVLLLVGMRTLTNPTQSEINTKNTEKLIGIICLIVAGVSLATLLLVLYVNRGKKDLPAPPASAYAMKYGPYTPQFPQQYAAAPPQPQYAQQYVYQNPQQQYMSR